MKEKLARIKHLYFLDLVFILSAIAAVSIFIDPRVVPRPNWEQQRNQCGGCLGLEDNGKVFTIALTSRITLELPDDGYEPGLVTVVPQGLLEESYPDEPLPGNWSLVFYAVKTGRVVIEAKPKNDKYPNFRSTLNILKLEQTTLPSAKT